MAKGGNGLGLLAGLLAALCMAFSAAPGEVAKDRPAADEETVVYDCASDWEAYRETAARLASEGGAGEDSPDGGDGPYLVLAMIKEPVDFSDFGARTAVLGPNGLCTLAFDTEDEADGAAAALSGDARVVYAERDQSVSANAEEDGEASDFEIME